MRKFSRVVIALSHTDEDKSGTFAPVVEMTNGDNYLPVSDFKTALHMLPAGSEVSVVANGRAGNLLAHYIAGIIRDSGVLVSLDLSSVEEFNHIYDSPFKDNPNLISISFPENLSSINSGAFSGCKNLEHVSSPGSVKKIGARAFEGCEKLVVLEFSDPNGWAAVREDGDVEPINNLRNAEDNPFRFTLPSSPYRKLTLQKKSAAI